jgi:hypothetical protein
MVILVILIYLISMILDIFLMYHLHKEGINRYYEVFYYEQISTIGDLFKAMDEYLDEPIDDSIYDFSCCFIPISNILTLCVLMGELFWNKIKNMQIK